MIPNILWQTWKTKNIPSSLNAQSRSWFNSNPQLKVKLSDDKDCSAFILENFGEEVHGLYQSLPQPIMRADFWRVAVVYVNGGYYADLDITCNKNISSFINAKAKAVFTKELDNIANFFFGAEPNHPVLKLALDYMIEEARVITDKNTQSYGMHSLHRAVREYYSVVGTDYPTNHEEVHILNNEHLKASGVLIHSAASITNNTTNGDDGYTSWRVNDQVMHEKRKLACDVLFFTTFNENGYELYGKTWIETFVKIANYYPSIKAKIYYEGRQPPIDHPNITYVSFTKEIPQHRVWKDQLRKRSTHDDYVKTMIERFSYKSFVIQDVLEKHNNDYLIWLDGDCVFKPADYSNFPRGLLEDKFLACQVEENHDLNHIESGILIFNGKHCDTKKFNERFIKNYTFEELLPMGQPYDGFVIFRTLLMSNLKYINLNERYGRGGIQSDPNCTFQHPDIKSKFIHNIGWTGKHQYDNWDEIFSKDEIFNKVKGFLFGNAPAILAQRREIAHKKLNSLLNKRASIKR
jgi:hypothetical protein